MMNHYLLRKSLLAGLTLFLLAQQAFSQGKWEVPADKKDRVAPFKFDVKTVQTGKDIFSKNCISCHGTPGMGNNIPMVPLPRDPASKEYQANVDGELFYKMTEGRGAMPSFKNSIEEKDRWAIISYIRSFNKTYVQPEAKGGSEAKGKIGIALTLSKAKDSITIKLTQKVEAITSPIRGFAVTLWAKRYFGELKIEDEKTSNDNGIVRFACPKKLPADSLNLIKLKVKVSNEAAGISVSKDTILPIGILKSNVRVLENRAFWNVRSMAPIWLILAYNVSVLVVFGILGYIIFLLFKIWKSGKENKE
jgi:mono/diheme cytochrome c family protein